MSENSLPASGDLAESACYLLFGWKGVVESLHMTTASPAAVKDSHQASEGSETPRSLPHAGCVTTSTRYKAVQPVSLWE